MKQSLSSLDHRLSRVGEAGDFSGFMNVYAELLDAELKLAGRRELMLPTTMKLRVLRNPRRCETDIPAVHWFV